jgi:protein XagA
MKRWIALVLLVPCSATAGAWTNHGGHAQVITTLTSSNAELSFGNHGRATIPIAFNKMSAETLIEYGLTGAITLILKPTIVSADVATPGAKAEHANSVSFEAGGRILLFGRGSKLSVQATYKTAGAFDMSVSAGHAAGRQIDVRFLYGTNYKLFGDDGFVDIEAGVRFIGLPRPDETPVDLTAGLWVMPHTMIMAQSFNIISGGATAPYTRYRTHKVEFSVVQKLNDRWSLQSSAFFSPAGQNALDETGFSVALWTQF